MRARVSSARAESRQPSPPPGHPTTVCWYGWPGGGEGRTRSIGKRASAALLFAGVVLVAAACEPTVRVEAPREPITINLNIKADVRLRIEQQAEKDIEANKEIF